MTRNCTWVNVLRTVLILILLFWIRAMYILFYPFVPLVIHSVEIKDNNSTIKAGDELTFVLDYEKKMKLPSKISKRLVNNYVIILPESEGYNPVGRRKILDQISIPAFADPGNYKLYLDFDYEIGAYPTRNVRVTAISKDFKIHSPNLPLVKDPMVLENQIKIDKLAADHRKITRELVNLKEVEKAQTEELRKHRAKSTYDKFVPIEDKDMGR